MRCQCQRQVGVTETLLGCRVGTGPPARAAATDELRAFGGEERRIEQRELGRRRGRAGEWRRQSWAAREEAAIPGSCWGALLASNACTPGVCAHTTRETGTRLWSCGTQKMK